MSDISQLLDQLNIDDHSVRNTIGDLIEVKKKNHFLICC
jgi:hypothetical protein